jgi:hypothetical protein
VNVAVRMSGPRILARNGARVLTELTGDMVVSGSPVSHINGIYERSGTRNGRALYVKLVPQANEIYWNIGSPTSQWTIFTDAVDDGVYESVNDVATPDLASPFNQALGGDYTGNPTVAAETEVVSVPHLNFSVKSS